MHLESGPARRLANHADDFQGDGRRDCCLPPSVFGGIAAAQRLGAKATQFEEISQHSVLQIPARGELSARQAIRSASASRCWCSFPSS